MAKLSVVAGATSQSVNVKIYILATGAGQTGLAYNSTGLTCYYTFTGANATATAVTLATLAAVNSAWSSGGFKEIDATHMPGVYRLDLPNAVIAASKGRSVNLTLTGFAGMADCDLEIELTGWDNQDAVRGGMTAMPNVASGSAGAIITSGTGTAQLSVTSGVAQADAAKIGGTAQTGRDIGASVLLSAGTGAGQLDFTSGVVKSNLVQILATALTETAGLLAGGFKKFFNVAVPTLTCLGVDQTGDSFARVGAAGAGLTALGDTRIANLDATVSSRLAPAGTLAACTLVTTTTTATNLTNAPTAGDFTSTMKTSLNAATPASVTGAVGSVTGNVGGNVTGSVGSVVGAVGSVTGAVGSVTGAVGSVTGNVGGNVVGSVASVTARVTANTDQFAGQTITAAAGVTMPATVASTTNITGGTITTVTNLTNAPTAGDFTATMKTSLNSATPASVTTVTGNVNGNVAGSVASVTARVTANTDQLAGQAVTAAAGVTFPTSLASPTNITAASGVALTSAYDPAKTAAQAGDIMKVSSGTGANQVSLAAGLVTIGTNNDKTGYSLTQAFPTNFSTFSINGSGQVVSASVAGAVASVTGNVGGNITGSVGSLATQAKTDVENATWDATLASHLTSGSTGAALNAAGAAGDPWSTAIPGSYGAGTAGNIVGNRIDAAISTRTKPADTQAAVTLVATTTNLTNAATSGDLTATMKTSVTTAASAATPSVTVSDKTGFSLSAAGVQAVWDALTSALTTVGSIGKRIADYVDVAISSRSTYAGADTAGTTTLLARVPGTVQPQTGDAYARLGAPAGASVSADIAQVESNATAIKAKTDNLPASPAAVGSAMTLTAAYDAAKTAGDATAANQTTINNNVLTRLAASAYTAPDNADIAAIKAKTDNLPASPAATGAQMDLINAPNATAITAIHSGLATSAAVAALPTAAANADKLLGRNIAGGSDGVRTVTQAIQTMRNRVTTTGGNLTVYREDDVTPSWTGVLTTYGGAEPIIEVDPA